MAEAFELYASFKIDTSGYTQELNKIRQEMQQFQQEELCISPERLAISGIHGFTAFG